MDFKYKNLSLLCRFCLLESAELKLLSETTCQYTFTLITGVELGNTLPDKVCVTCESTFTDFTKFIDRIKENNDFLNRELKNVWQEKENENYNDFNNSLDDTLSKDSIGFEVKLEKLEESTNKIKSVNNIGKISSSLEAIPRRGSSVKRKKCFFNRFKSLTESKNKDCIPKSNKLICHQCNIAFPHKVSLDAHYKENPTCQPKNFSCTSCDKVFNNKHKLSTHMRSHTKEEPFECQECGKKFRFQQNLRRHVLIHNGIKPFKCEICKKEFSRAHVLNEHMNIHTGYNPYVCNYCGKGFKRYANHFIHVYRHKLCNGEVDLTKDRKLYLQLECNICNKIFASQGGLSNHLGLHQEEREKRFLCNECGKGFVTKSQLESHIRTHTGERPYECSECKKRFRQKSAFSNHMRMHAGKKPYQCTVCEKFFTQSGHLKIHMRVHSGEKPYNCTFCGKAFALKYNLKVHTRIHTGETPYVCSVCNHGCYDSTSLKKHMKCHGVIVPRQGYVANKSGNTDDVIEISNSSLITENTLNVSVDNKSLSL